jgi:chemotaxis protein methyltransferase CheR
MAISPEIGISETRNLLALLRNNYEVDFSCFAMASFRRRIEAYLTRQGYRSIEPFLDDLADVKRPINDFIHSLVIESTEMFRDPSFWITLSDNVLPRLFSSIGEIKIWAPACISGDELFSLCMLLAEKFPNEKYSIDASYFSETSYALIKSGNMPMYKFETSNDNCRQVLGLELECEPNADFYHRKLSYIENVKFFKQQLSFDQIPENEYHLILLRNRLLMYNQAMQQKIAADLHARLHPMGFLAVGIKERPEGGVPARLFSEYQAEESIYRKK